MTDSLAHRGPVIHESNGITQYLDEVSAGPFSYPAEPCARTQAKVAGRFRRVAERRSFADGERLQPSR